MDHNTSDTLYLDENLERGERHFQNLPSIQDEMRPESFRRNSMFTHMTAKGSFAAWTRSARLAILTTTARIAAAAEVLKVVPQPHWLDAVDQPNAMLQWSDGRWSYGPDVVPWHRASGQPNDHNGDEKCVFIASTEESPISFFDFTCAAKKAEPRTWRHEAVTPGPEVTWRDGVRREYNIQPLCGMMLTQDEVKKWGMQVVTEKQVQKIKVQLGHTSSSEADLQCAA
jgi:hypothetical protein